MGYYMGDYYAGDPGFGSLLRGAGRLIGRGARYLGIGARKAPLALPAAAGVAAAATTAIETIGGAAGGMVRRGAATIIRHPVISAAAAAGTIGALGGAVGRGVMGPGAVGLPGRGFHIARRGARAGQLVRNRRMRVTNPKALRRALRRAQGFAKLAMRTIHLIHPRKKGRFGGFRKRRAKRV